MQPSQTELLNDAFDAVSYALKYAKRKSREEFLTSALLRSAIQFNLVITAYRLEALCRDHAAIVAPISNSEEIIAFGKALLSRYSEIHDDATWEFVGAKLPLLLRELEALLNP